MMSIDFYCHRKGPTGPAQVFRPGTNAKKIACRGNRWYIGSQPRGKMEIPDQSAFRGMTEVGMDTSVTTQRRMCIAPGNIVKGFAA